MHRSAKIATCCYCGTRAALTLSGGERHELACSSCGAPLHELKMLKAEPRPKPAKYGAPSARPVKSKQKRKKKKKKSFAERAFSEFWDIAEDIFD